jgi:UDP-N-acetyl-2-amino-2-deoxyglucuronate dehydrogenase
MPRTQGFGIIGAGVIAAMHAEAITGLPGARLAAVTDVLPGAARDLAARYGCAAEPDTAALLSRADVDVVCVCVPSGRHAEAGVQAAAAGKHLVIEKPVEVSLAAADRLMGAAQAAGVTLTVISQHRFDAGLTELRRLLDTGALGRLVLGEARTKWYRTQAYYDSAAWRGTDQLDGGSLLNQGVHYVDLLCWAMGRPAEVSAVCATLAHDMEAEDVATALLRFPSGAVGTIVTSTAVYPGFAQRLEISGTGGTVIVEDGRIVTRALRAEDEPAGPAAAESAAGGPDGDGPDGSDEGGSADPAALAVAPHRAQLADLLAAIEDGRPPAVTGADGRVALEVMCAVYQSAREGHPVALPAGQR